MANITAQSPIRYNIDTLDTASYGVIISDANAIDCATASKVKKCSVTGNIPAASRVFFLFNIGGSWVRLDASGHAETITSSTPDFSVLEESGNTPAELNALSNIPAFAGQRFGTAIGLWTSDPVNAVPSVALSLKCETDTQILQTEKYSPVYEFKQAQIVKIDAPVTSANQGRVSLTAQYKGMDGQKSAWLPIEQVAGKQINALQFRAVYFVDRTGGDSLVSLNSADIVYTEDNGVITGGGADAELVTLTQNWYMNVKECRLTVKHAPLVNSKIRAYAALRPESSIIRGEQLGIGSGNRRTFQLKNTNGIKYDSVRLYYDNVRVYSDFEMNTAAGRITCEAPDGVIVSCDYEYNWAAEQWHEMTLTARTSLMDYDNSEYRISFKEDNLAVAALKIAFEMSGGTITREKIGTGTGRMQSYKLSRICADGEITVYSGSTALNKKYYALHEDTQYLSITASQGAALYATYKWISEAPVVYQIAAVFSE